MQTQSLLLPRPLTLTPDALLVAAAGFLATLAITTTMYLLPAIGLPQVDLPLWVARFVARDPVHIAAVGLAVHFIVGLSFARVYARHVEPRLALAPAASGATFGVTLWLFAQLIAVPALGAIGDALGHGAAVLPGVASHRFGAGAAFGSLASHLAYGVVLGFVYGCKAGGQCRAPRNH